MIVRRLHLAGEDLRLHFKTDIEAARLLRVAAGGGSCRAGRSHRPRRAAPHQALEAQRHHRMGVQAQALAIGPFQPLAMARELRLGGVQAGRHGRQS